MLGTSGSSLTMNPPVMGPSPGPRLYGLSLSLNWKYHPVRAPAYALVKKPKQAPVGEVVHLR